MGHPGPVRRLLRRQGQGLLQGGGLDVTIKPGGPDIAPEQVLAGGGADVVVDWLPAALAAREKGAAMVNIAQPFKHSGLELTCRADTGIKKPEDLKGRTLGVWFYGNEYPFLNWMGKLKFPTDGSPGGVKVVKQGFNVDPLLQKQADCISTMTYNEYWQVIDAGYKPEQLVVFKYEDQGVATLEDGLYVMEDKLKDPAFVDKMARFVKASMKGWEYARAHPEEAVKIVLDNDSTGAQTEHHQTQMLGEINKLTDRLRRQARQGRLRPHGEDAADRRLGPSHLQGADRRLYHRHHRQGAREVSPRPSSPPPFGRGGRNWLRGLFVHAQRRRRPSRTGRATIAMSSSRRETDARQDRGPERARLFRHRSPYCSLSACRSGSTDRRGACRPAASRPHVPYWQMVCVLGRAGFGCLSRVFDRSSSRRSPPAPSLKSTIPERWRSCANLASPISRWARSGSQASPVPAWLTPAALVGFLYYGLAGIGHVARQERNAIENTALISDLLIAALLAVFLATRLTR